MKCWGSVLRLSRVNMSQVNDGLATRDENRVVFNLNSPTIAHPIHSAVQVEEKRVFVIYDTFKVVSRLIDRMEEAPIPPVGTPRVTGGFDLQQRPHPPQGREVRGLRPKQLQDRGK